MQVLGRGAAAAHLEQLTQSTAPALADPEEQLMLQGMAAPPPFVALGRRFQHHQEWISVDPFEQNVEGTAPRAVRPVGQLIEQLRQASDTAVYADCFAENLTQRVAYCA